MALWRSSTPPIITAQSQGCSSGRIPLDGSVRRFRASTASIRTAPTATTTLGSFAYAAVVRWCRDSPATSASGPAPKVTGLEVSGKLTTEKDMTNANERHEDIAEDRVAVIKARIRWLNEMLKQLQFKTPAKETKH